VGYGISSIHYDNARQMNNGQIKDLIDRYKGEVYYIRGLDCWDSQTYHKKAVEHRIATTCDVFEREMDMTGVKNILITNNYWVQIAKFNGRKNYNPQKIISVNEPQAVITDSTQTKPNVVKVHYELKEKSKATANWHFTLKLNNNSIKSEAYASTSQDLEINISDLKPGFNQIRFIIEDHATHSKLADISKYYFEKANGAIALTDLPIESHQQGWGKMHKNESIEGNKFKINGISYENGIGTHAASTTVFDIGKKFSRLTLSAGLDEESLCSEGVAIEILGDGKSLEKTPFFGYSNMQNLSVNVSGVQKLTIKTIPKESINCSHVDIINPVLTP